MALRKTIRAGSEEILRLPEATEQLLEECRMVLPGIQALFGFQLIAVFSPGFSKELAPGLQVMHFAATVLTSVAVALVMTPAAYHRIASPRAVSDGLIAIATRLLLWSMVPLAASICLEIYIVGYSVLKTPWVAALAATLFAMFLTLWLALPAARRRRNASD